VIPTVDPDEKMRFSFSFIGILPEIAFFGGIISGLGR